ncbi:MAG TPA: IS66 family transposase [Gemmatimonadaceae bacterium]|nr:IS66 family transposase [Gemmatimonadaceae bacterium]
MPPQAPLVITREEVLAVYAQGPEAVVSLVLTLVERINALEARVAALEAERAKDSRTSSKPPSGDVVRRPRSLRGKSGKRPGGQPGHDGHTLALRAEPDRVIEHAPAACAGCGAALPGRQGAGRRLVPGERRQVFELPPVRLTCTEHRLLEQRCPACGTWTPGRFPAAARTTAQYGPGLLGLGVYLTTQHLLPVARAAEVLAALTGRRVSPATLVAAEARGASALAPVMQRIRAGLTRAPVIHVDETGFFIAGRRQWLHTVSTPALTYYTPHAKRGCGAHDAIGLLPAYAGTAVHDCYDSYFTYPCRHALCVVHLLRELTFFAEEHGARWAAALKRSLLAMKRGVARARAAGRAALERRTRRRYEGRYDALLAAGEAAQPPPRARTDHGGRPRRTPAGNLLVRLRRHRAAVLRFLDDFAVPFDNSEAERDLRMMKVEQKVSGGFRTPHGAQTFCTLRGYVATARKQGGSALDALRELFAGHPFIPAVPE